METWYAYQCLNPECPDGPPKTGVVLDVRLPEEREAPEIPCPICGEPLEFGEHWPSTEGGYGSRADTK